MKVINFSRIPLPPTIQASNLVTSQVSDTQLRLSWVRGNGVKCIVVGRLTLTPNSTPVGGSTYTPNFIFGTGSQLSTDIYTLYVGTDNTVLITGLTASTPYTFYVYEINQRQNGTEQYNINISTNTVSQTTLIPQVAPTTQATNLTFRGLLTGDVTAGNGIGRLWLYNTSGAINASFLPVDGVTYTVGQNIGGGNIVGGVGSSTRFYIENLPFSTSVAHRVFEYNITSGTPLYNLNTATGNPLVQSTIADEVYVGYKDIPQAFQTRRTPFNLLALGSRDGCQKYATADWIGSTHHHVWLVTEGDGSRLGGIDRTIRVKRALTDDPTIPSNFVPDGPPDAFGDVPSFIDSSCLQYPEWVAGSYNIGDRVRVTIGVSMKVYESTANGNVTNPTGGGGSNWIERVMWDGNQCWMMSVVEHGGFQYGIYVGNRVIAGRYGVGMIVSNDEFETYTRFESPIIPEGSSFAAYYCHVHPTKIGGFWYMFVQNYVPSLLVEDHLYCCQIWRTANDPNPAGTWTGWTNLTGTTDVLSGRGYGGAVDISTPWDEGGKMHFYISPNDANQTGAYNAGSETGTVAKTTFPVGNKIYEASIDYSQIANFRTEHIIEREVYRSDQQCEIELRAFCPKRSFGGNNFFVGMGFKWKCQTLLNGIAQNEPMNEAQIISQDVNLTGNVLVGKSVYPNWIDVLFKPHQSHLNDVLGTTPLPWDVLNEVVGTVVNNPRAGRCNTILPINPSDSSSNGYVTRPTFAYNANKLAVKVIVGENTISSEYGIACQDDPSGQRGWSIWRSSQYKFRVKVYGSDNVSYKEYEFTILGNKAGNDSTLLNMVGFIFDNGTLRCCIDYNLNCTPTIIRNDSFTQMNVSNAPIMLGRSSVNNNTFKLSSDVVGPIEMFSGANVTDDHYLNNNFIGY